MGYDVRIGITGDAERLCRLLVDSPAEIFNRPFFGYILFLLTGREEELLKILSKELLEFDSLSKDIFAYAIVARELAIPIDEVVWQQEAYQSGFASRDALSKQQERVKLSHLKTADLQEFAHRFNRSDRGELLAMSDAVNEVAKWFGVTPQLPCMLVFDAIPDQDPIALPLDGKSIQGLVPTFRRVVGHLSGAEYRTHIRMIQRLGELANLPAPPDFIDEESVRTQIVEDVGRRRSLRDAFRKALCDGSSIGQVAKSLGSLAPPPELHNKVQSAIGQSHGIRKKLSDAIRVADECIAAVGTEFEPTLKPRRIFRRRLAQFLSAESAINVPLQKADWAAVRAELESRLASEVSLVIALLPSMAGESPEQLATMIGDAYAKATDEITARRRAIEQKEIERRELFSSFSSFSLPPFSGIVSRELRRTGFEHSINHLSTKVGSWLSKPSNLKWISKIALQVAKKSVDL